MNLVRLSHFVAVADAGTMTRAADRLHLTQQAVSSSIRQLERDLGVAVFRRVGRRVELTPGGTALRTGATTLLAAADTLVAATVQASQESPRPFVVAHTPAITSDEVFLLLNALRQEMPAHPVEVHQTYPDHLTAGILDGTFDIGLRRGVVPPTDLSGAVIAHDPLRAAVAADHPLARRSTVGMGDLAHHPITVWAPAGSSFYTDYLLSVCRRAGFDPAVRVNSTQGTTPATAVVGTDTFAFVTQAAGPTLADQVVVIPIEDAPHAPVQMLWLPHTRSRAREVLLSNAPSSPAGG